jgi:hypothetical protein
MTYLKFSATRLRACLAADHVGVICERGLLRRRTECASARVRPAEAGALPWATAVHALGELIADRGWRGSTMDVALSSEWVRFALVPGIRRHLTSSEMQGLAHGIFARLLGEAAPAWDVRYCVADRSTVLGAAVEKALLEALEDMARNHRCTLRSVSPLWLCAANRRRRRLARRSEWLVLAEARAVAYGLIERGTWRVVRARAVDASGQGAGVAQWLERENRNLGTTVRNVVFAGESREEELPAEWKVERMPFAAPRLGALPPECRPAALAGC